MDLGAPGVNVLSSRPNNAYGTKSGTSMACPHVSGAVALVMAQFPAMDLAAVKVQILNTVDPLDSLAGNTLTGGRLNLARAVGGTPDPADGSAPAAVTDLAASLEELAATLSWTATGDDGTAGQAYLYDVRYLADTPLTEAYWDSATATSGEPQPQPAGSMETFTVYGLSADTTYYLALKAIDEAGNFSSLSNVVSATIGALPPGSWIIEVVSESGPLTHYNLGLAYDPLDGNPSVVYDDDSPGLRFAHWNGSSWDKESIDPGGSLNDMALVDLAYDPREPNTDRNPTLGVGFGTRFIRWDQGSQTWDLEDVVNGSWLSMAYDPTDNYPSISYGVERGKGKKNKQQYLALVHFDGSSWASEDIVAEAVEYTSLAYDGAGNPAIAYRLGLGGGANAVKYAWLTGTAWQIEEVHVSARYVDYLSLAYDPTTSYPAIAFTDREGGYALKFASWNGVSWDVEVVHSGVNVSSVTSLKLDPDGNPTMVYTEHTDGHVNNPNEPVYFARKVLGP